VYNTLDEVDRLVGKIGELMTGMDYVVLCGGMWTRDLAAGIGVAVPLHACEHYYVLFQDVPGLTPDMPVLRDYDHCSYFKYDAGKLLVGASGLAGYGSSDRIVTRKIRDRFYLIGDSVSEVSESVKPYAPCVAIAAAKEADVVLDWVLSLPANPGKG